MHPELDRLIDASFVDGVTDLPIEELRSRRFLCQAREESVSYLRRVVQVRLDLLGTELAHRQSGDAPADTDELLARLPEVLSEHGRAPGFGQAPRDLRAPDIDADLVALVDEIVPPGLVGDMGATSPDELAALVDRLGTLEHEISSVRRALHVQLDALQAELTRRYRTGEATVDALLH
ncbi:MAG: RsiG family protein [Acidimicrobiales bacterium]